MQASIYRQFFVLKIFDVREIGEAPAIKNSNQMTENETTKNKKFHVLNYLYFALKDY